MKASKHEDDNLFNDPGIQYQKETITENITILDYFLDLINKSLKLYKFDTSNMHIHDSRLSSSLLDAFQ